MAGSHLNYRQQIYNSAMEQNINDLEYLHELNKPNPIQKKCLVAARSITAQLPLPLFKFSEEQVDLAAPLAVIDQKQEHTLKENNLAKLFEKPIYTSNLKLNPLTTNLKFGCVRAFYSQSAVYPPPAVQLSSQQSQIMFESRFQSGNLAYVQKSDQPNEYFLLLHKDINTTRCTQWFFFRVQNFKFRGRIRFHILNFIKGYSSFQNGMKVAYCRESGGHVWTRGCEDIAYSRNNLKINNDRSYYSLSFSYVFEHEDDATYFAHSPPYTFSMLDRFLLSISNNANLMPIVRRKTLTVSPGQNYVDMLTITNFKSKKQKKIVFITARVHPGQTPASFVCEGIINFLIGNSQDAVKLREVFVFKIVPMLNPDGVINGNYRCSLSGYDLNRVWHCDNKQSSPQIYYTKRAILQNQKIFLFMDLHAHSKKKGVFMYGCQSRTSPYISRQIPYLLWKEVSAFNYYQCNFNMRVGREGTSRLAINRLLNLPYCYTMEHSFCSSIKQKHHFTSQHYREIGEGICGTLRKYFCIREQIEEIELFKELYENKEFMKVGNCSDGDSSKDSELDAPVDFKQTLDTRRIVRLKPNINLKWKAIDTSSMPSASKMTDKILPRDLSPRKFVHVQDTLQPLLTRLNFTTNFPQKASVVQQVSETKQSKQPEIKGDQVFLSGRLSEQQPSTGKIKQQTLLIRSTSRYQFEQMQSLNNLFLPSLTSASYKRYAKKKNYARQFIQVGKKYLSANGMLKDEIRSVSRKKASLKQQALSYI